MEGRRRIFFKRETPSTHSPIKNLLSRTYTSPLGEPESPKKERFGGRLSLKERHLLLALFELKNVSGDISTWVGLYSPAGPVS